MKYVISSYNWHPVGGEIDKDLMLIGNQVLLILPAQEAKAKYDKFLDIYKTYLEENRDEAVRLLDAELPKP